MAKATLDTAPNDAVDWRALADQIFPAEPLRMVPVFNLLNVVSNIL
jgi:hypothetical protein